MVLGSCLQHIYLLACKRFCIVLFFSLPHMHNTFILPLFIPAFILAEEGQCLFCYPFFLISHVANSYTQCTKYNYINRNKKAKDPKIQPYVSSPVLSLFVSLIYKCFLIFFFVFTSYPSPTDIFHSAF